MVKKGMVISMKKWLIGIAAFVFWVAVWQIVGMCIAQEVLFPLPSAVASALLRLAATAKFRQAVGMSMLRILTGYVSGMAAGTVLAAATARWKAADAIISPLLRTIRAVPVASFIILLLIWISASQLPAVSVFLMITPLAWDNVSEGIRRTDIQLLEVARVFRLGRRQELLRIRVPSVMPYFITAATSGLGLAWKSGIAAEVISLPAMSIGKELRDAKIYIETPEVFAWTVVVIVLSLALEKLFKLAIARFGRRYNMDTQS